MPIFGSIGLFHTPPPCSLIPEPAPPLALALSRNRSTHAALTPSVLSWMSPLNASQRSPCRSELCDKNAPGAKLMEEIQGGPHGRVLSSPAVAMRGMDDKPCADAEERAANSVKARSVQVRPQCSHSSSRHFFCHSSSRMLSLHSHDIPPLQNEPKS